MDQNLNLNVDLTRVLAQVDQLTERVGQLETGAEDFRKAAGGGFEAVGRSASDMNKDFKNTQSILKGLEKDLRDMEKIKAAGGRVDEKVYDRVNKDIVKYRNNLGALKAELKKVGDQTSMVGQASEKTFSRLNQYLTGAAIVYAGKQLMELAVSLDVVNAKSKTVFGQYAADLDVVAQKVAKSMGMTGMQYKKAASAIGDLLVPMKFSRKEAFVLSTGLLQLSGALSEWTGGMYSAEEVSRIFTKAMLGEREELKSLGVSITEADVQERLLEKGQAKLTGTMLKQAEAIATMELIQEKSVDAQTAFAASGDSLRRQYAELQASFKTLGGTLAVELIPVFQKFFGFINNNLPAILKWAKYIGIATLGIIGYRKGVQLAMLINKAFQLSMAATPWGAVLAAIGLIGGALASYFLLSDKAADSSERFVQSQEDIDNSKAAGAIDDMSAAMWDFADGTDEAVKKINAALGTLTADQLQKTREQLEAEIVKSKDTIAQIEADIAKMGPDDPAKTNFAEMLAVNQQGLENLRTALDATIERMGKLTGEPVTPTIDYSKVSTAELEKQLEKLSEVREDLLTNEQKEVKKSIEFELGKRKKAADLAEKIERERKEHEKLLEDTFSKTKQRIMEKDSAWREKVRQDDFDKERLTTDQLIAERQRLTDKYGELLNTGDVAQNEANQRRLEYVNKELDYQMSIENKKKEAIRNTYGDMVEFARSAYKETEQGQKEALKRELELLMALRTTGVISAEEFSAAFAKLNDQIAGMDTFAKEHPLASMLGLDEKELDAVQTGYDSIMSTMDTLVQRQIDDSTALIDDLTRRIDETTSLYQAEVALKVAGYANDAEQQRKSLDQMKLARAAEMKDKEKAIQTQRTLDAIKQSMNLATTASELISELGGSVIGLVIAGIAIASMFALFATAKTKASEVTQMEKGGPLKGPSHRHGGMRIEGTNIEVEGDEFLVNKHSAFKYGSLIRAINQDNPDAIKIAFNRQFLSKPVIIMPQKDFDDSKKLGRIVELLSQGTVVVGDGFIMERKKGYTKKIYLN